MMVLGLVLGCTRSRYEQNGDYHKAYDEYREQVRDDPGDRAAREGLKRTAPFAVAYWQKQASNAAENGDWIKAALCHSNVLEIRPDELSSILSLREIQRNHPREYASAMRERAKLNESHESPTLTSGAPAPSKASSAKVQRPTPADEDVTARTAPRSKPLNDSTSPAAQPKSRAIRGAADTRDDAARSVDASTSNSTARTTTPIAAEPAGTPAHQPTDLNSGNVRMASAETTTPVETNVVGDAPAATPDSTATLAEAKPAGEKNITMDFADDQDDDDDNATTSAPANDTDSDADVQINTSTTTAPAATSASTTPKRVTGKITVPTSSQPTESAKPAAKPNGAITGVIKSVKTTAPASTKAATSSAAADANASASTQQPLRASDGGSATDSGASAPLTERRPAASASSGKSVLDSGDPLFAMGEPKRRYKVVAGDPYKQKTVVLYPADVTKGEFAFIVQASRKDKRFHKHQQLLDGLSVKIEDADSDPLDCDFEVHLGKKKVIDLKDIREGAVMPVIGESHRMFELVVIHINAASKTVTFGLRSVEE